ncbi:MAG: DUF177 domain-containing protein [Oscillochloris sp.]|nr:DUF177 domain-containing protein [Oscillochloris sp.]
MSTIKFNVAQLLREEIGARRELPFTEPLLSIDNDLTMRDLDGLVRFTRTVTGVYAHVQVRGVVELICVRSLEPFDYPIELDFRDEFHSVIDVISGVHLPTPPEDDPFMLSDAHLADIGEAIREYALLELPLNPVSPEYRDRPVSYSVQSDDLDEEAENADSDESGSLEALKAWAERHNRKNK